MTEDEEFEFRHRLEQEQSQSTLADQPMGGKPPLGFVAKQVMDMTPMAHPVKNLPLAGAMVGSTFGNPGLGAAAGGGLAKIAQNMAGIYSGDPNVPRTATDAALSAGGEALGAGIAQEPKVLMGIPGVPQVSKMVGNLASKVGTNVSKFAEAMTGAKVKDLQQAAKQGLSTYAAPSMEKAQGIFGQAMEKAGISSKPPIEHIIDPQLQTARDTALHVGKLIDEEIPLTAQEALLGRQSVDRIYAATPLRDRSTLKHLSELRTLMDDELSKASGPLKEASTTYRQAIVKSNLLNPLRMTKQGQMSAVAPMVATLAASAGLGSGHKEGSALGGLGYLAASSPAIAGLGFASAGQAGQAINAIAQNPAARQALLQVLQRIRQNSQQPQAQP